MSDPIPSESDNQTVANSDEEMTGLDLYDEERPMPSDESEDSYSPADEASPAPFSNAPDLGPQSASDIEDSMELDTSPTRSEVVTQPLESSPDYTPTTNEHFNPHFSETNEHFNTHFSEADEQFNPRFSERYEQFNPHFSAHESLEPGLEHFSGQADFEAPADEPPFSRPRFDMDYEGEAAAGPVLPTTGGYNTFGNTEPTSSFDISWEGQAQHAASQDQEPTHSYSDVPEQMEPYYPAPPMSNPNSDDLADVVESIETPEQQEIEFTPPRQLSSRPSTPSTSQFESPPQESAPMDLSLIDPALLGPEPVESAPVESVPPAAASTSSPAPAPARQNISLGNFWSPTQRQWPRQRSSSVTVNTGNAFASGIMTTGNAFASGATSLSNPSSASTPWVPKYSSGPSASTGLFIPRFSSAVPNPFTSRYGPTSTPLGPPQSAPRTIPLIGGSSSSAASAASAASGPSEPARPRPPPAIPPGFFDRPFTSAPPRKIATPRGMSVRTTGASGSAPSSAGPATPMPAALEETMFGLPPRRQSPTNFNDWLPSDEEGRDD
jgi:hypothetical protein